MYQSFYVSGFLYHLKSQQILLLQSAKNDDQKCSWSILGGESYEGEEAQEAFQRVINEKLNLALKDKDTYPIYDYFHETLEKTNYVFYAEIKKIPTFESPELSWVTFDESVKFLFADHTKQDLVVGERVIKAKVRDEQAKKDLLLAPELPINL